MLYLSQKCSDCHETKSKHTDWTLGLKCDHRVWPWPWIFKVKYRICYISANNGPIATKRKANISIELQASNVTNGFNLDHNLDLWILKVKHYLDLWPHTWPWPWIFMVKFWYSCISESEGWLTLHKGGGSRSFMTMTMTIWWPRSDVWIYRIVTGVTSVVDVPSTHLVNLMFMIWIKERLRCHLVNSGPIRVSRTLLRVSARSRFRFRHRCAACLFCSRRRSCRSRSTPCQSKNRISNFPWTCDTKCNIKLMYRADVITHNPHSLCHRLPPCSLLVAGTYKHRSLQ